MPETNIGNLDYSDLTNSIDDWEVDEEITDGVSDQKETTYIIKDWPEKFGYYKHIPELAAAIDAKATWTVGKGFVADEPTSIILEMIKGVGMDTFNTILENMIRTYHIAGDAYTEIIRDEKSDMIINLKPLDPSSIRIVANRKGKIIRYEQIKKIEKKHLKKKIPVENIFHLSRNRVADEIHGQSVITQVEEIIKMRNEAMSDWKRVLHRNIEPLWIFHLDTDDTSKIATFKAKMDAARGKGENMYIPKGAVVPELVSTATNATLSPLAWIESLNKYFFQAVGVPAIIVGNSQSLTEASAKMEYLVWQQTVEEEQLYIEEQILAQLNIALKLEFPARLENELLSDKPRNEAPQVNAPQIQQNEKANEANDTTAEMEGRK
jgi:hypothetical protein